MENKNRIIFSFFISTQVFILILEIQYVSVMVTDRRKLLIQSFYFLHSVFPLSSHFLLIVFRENYTSYCVCVCVCVNLTFETIMEENSIKQFIKSFCFQFSVREKHLMPKLLWVFFRKDCKFTGKLQFVQVNQIIQYSRKLYT